MFDVITRILPPLTLWTLLLFIILLVLKNHYIPLWISHYISTVPLSSGKVDLQSLKVQPYSNQAGGFILDLRVLLPKVPIGMTVTIPTLKVYIKQELIAILHLSSSILLGGSDLTITQTIVIDFCQSVHTLNLLLKSISVLGIKELYNISLRLEFESSIDIFGIVFERVKCTRAIPLLELMDFRPTTSCLPNYTLSPFINPPTLKTLVAGIHIEFDNFPNIEFGFLKSIEFRLLLNGSSIADCVLAGCQVSPSLKSIKVKVEVGPVSGRAMVNTPFHVTKGVVKGTLSGLVNGVMNGQWGGRVLILGFKNLKFVDTDGMPVWWLDDLFKNVELEYDVEPVERVKGLRGVLTQLAVLVLQKWGSV